MLKGVVEQYLKLFPKDRPKLSLLLEQLENGDALDDRANFNGHVAGDAIIFSPDLKKILLIYHSQFNNWQQAGGHWDVGEEGPWLTAEREAEEETGLRGLKRINASKDYRVPIHIVTGPVPPSSAKKEPNHWHHDFRYGFIANSEDLPTVEDSGVNGAKWINLSDYKGEGAHNLNTSVVRLKQLLGLKA